MWLSRAKSTYTFSLLICETCSLLLCKMSWWVGYTPLGRGSDDTSKKLSFKLNLRDNAGLVTQRVFKCDLSRVLFMDFSFCFTYFFLPSWAPWFRCICFIPFTFFFLLMTGFLGSRLSSLCDTFRPLLLALGYWSSLIWKGMGDWFMAYLCCYHHCSCIKLHMLTSSKSWEILQGDILRCSELIQNRWFLDQRLN